MFRNDSEVSFTGVDFGSIGLDMKGRKMTQQTINNRFREIKVYIPADMLPKLQQLAKTRKLSDAQMIHEILTRGLNELYGPDLASMMATQVIDDYTVGKAV